MIEVDESNGCMPEKFYLRLDGCFIDKLKLHKKYQFTVEIDAKPLRENTRNRSIKSCFPFILRVLGVRDSKNCSLFPPNMSFDRKLENMKMKPTQLEIELENKVKKLHSEVEHFFQMMLKLESQSNPSKKPKKYINLWSFLARNIAPSVFGMIPHKIAILLQIVLMKRPKTEKGRGTLHILMW